MIYNPDKDKDRETLGGSTNTLSASGARPMAASQPKATASGSFTNLRSYIDKNRGATNQSLNRARSDIGDFENQYKQNTDTMSSAREGANKDYSDTLASQNKYKSFANDPYSINKDDYNATSQRLNPNQDYLQRYSQAQANNRGLSTQQEALSNISSTGGVRSYLNNIRGNRAGSQGGTNLDQFLLQSSPESRATLNDIESRAKNVNLSTGLDNDLQQNYNQLAGFDKNAVDTRIQNRLDADFKEDDLTNVSRYNTIQDYLGSGKRGTYKERPKEVVGTSSVTPVDVVSNPNVVTSPPVPPVVTTGVEEPPKPPVPPIVTDPPKPPEPPKPPVVTDPPVIKPTPTGGNFTNNTGGVKDFLPDTSAPATNTQNTMSTGINQASNSLVSGLSGVSLNQDLPPVFQPVPPAPQTTEDLPPSLQPVTTMQAPVFMGGVTDITRNQPNILDYLRMQGGY